MERNPTKDSTNLQYQIEMLRQEMICTGIQEGFASERTIAISQKLDFYIAEYQFVYGNFLREIAF